MTTTVYKRLRFPAPSGLDCNDCDGTGVSGNLYQMETDPRPDGLRIVLLADTLCLACYAGLNPDYDPASDYDDEDHLDDQDEDEDQERPECSTCGQAHGLGDHVCPSCSGKHYNLVQSFPSGDQGNDDQEEDDPGMVYLVMPCGCAETLMEDVPAELVGA